MRIVATGETTGGTAQYTLIHHCWLKEKRKPRGPCFPATVSEKDVLNASPTLLSQNDCTRPTNSLTECAARQGLDSNCFVPPSSLTTLSDNCTQPPSSSTTKPPKKLDRSTSCNQHCQPGHPPSSLTVNQHVTCSVESPFRPSHR